MNCGVLCVKRLLEEYDCHNDLLLEELAEKVSDRGLSVADLMSALISHGFKAEAYKVSKPPVNYPHFGFDGRHYTLVLAECDRHLLIYDPNLGDVRIAAWFYRFFHPRYAIMIDKEK